MADVRRNPHASPQSRQIDLPVVRPVVTRVELFGGRCRCCGKRYRAAPAAGMLPGTPFGPGIRSLLAYLHHSHHVGFERLSRMLGEMFGLSISEGAIANSFRRMQALLDKAGALIKAKLLTAPVIASDETTTRYAVDSGDSITFMTDRRVPPTNNRSEQEWCSKRTPFQHET